MWAWAAWQAAQVRRRGRPLDAAELALARAVGVTRPQQIRVQRLPRVPIPMLRLARPLAGRLGLPAPDVDGMTLGHAIVVRAGAATPGLLAHECRHVRQAERAGSLGAFLRLYLRQIARHGYEAAPLEVDARRAAGIALAARLGTQAQESVMEQICDVMTRDVRVVSPHDTMQRAAQCMDELNVGVVPVCDGQRLLGVVTDRDIAVRGVAAGKPAEATPVTDVMSAHVRWCYEDQPIDEVMDEMRDTQIRRLPVVDRDKHLVGIVSLGDLAARGADGRRVAETLRDISTPSAPDRG